MSGENSIDQFIYNELTSTKYGNTTTNIEKEIALIKSCFGSIRVIFT